MHYFTNYVYFGPIVDSPEGARKKNAVAAQKYASAIASSNILKLHIDGTLEAGFSLDVRRVLHRRQSKGAPLLTLKAMLP
ncbi:MAG: hypothetical protein ACLUKN_06545 [Bacilli bacterium]